jgi:hypothetical protein
MLEELLMQETQPEVEAETKETVPQDAENSETTETEAKPTEVEDDSEQETEQEQDSGIAGAEQDNTEVSEEPAPVIRVKYNKQEREYSLDDAKPLVEMGLKYESFKPSYEKLKFLASTTGQSVSDLIDSLVTSNEQALYEQILKKANGNEEIAKELFEAKKAERQRKFDELKAQESEREKQEKEAEKNRLADEFIELKSEVGTFNEFSDVPKSVLKIAAKKGISLLDAYLRYERAERKKAEAVKAKQTEAAKTSTGSLNTETETPDNIYDDVMRAVFGN